MKAASFFSLRRAVSGAKEDDEISVSLREAEGQPSASAFLYRLDFSDFASSFETIRSTTQEFVDQRDKAVVKDQDVDFREMCYLEAECKGTHHCRLKNGSGMALHNGHISHIERTLRVPQRIEPRARSSLDPQ